LNIQRQIACIEIRNVEAVEYFLLPLPAPYNVSRFRVCFHFQPLSSKCFRFYRNTASTAFVPNFRFHIPAACFMKNASASGSLKSQKKSNAFEFSSASFFKVLPLPQKFNRFRFQLPLSHPWLKLIWYFKVVRTMLQTVSRN